MVKVGKNDSLDQNERMGQIEQEEQSEQEEQVEQEEQSEQEEQVEQEEQSEQNQKLETDSTVVTSAYLDRIEEVEKGVNRAVLYFGEDDEKVVIPVSMLPDDIKPDDTLEIIIRREKE